MLFDRFLKAILPATMILTGATIEGAEAPTYAERLGWPAGTRAVIFHVDDAGMSHNSNMGVIRALALANPKTTTQIGTCLKALFAMLPL